MAETSTTASGALERLTAVSRALTYAVSLEQVLEITVETAAELLDASRAVLLLQGDDGLLRVRAARGIEPEKVARFREPLDETLVGRLGAVLGPEAEDRFLGVPLVLRGRVIGLLAILRNEARAAERDEWLLSALADQASVAVESARQEEADEGLERQLRELEVREARRERALQVMGHDMRSPLNSLRGYVGLLQEEIYGPLTDGQREALSRLEVITEHLDALIGDALEMSRLAAGRLSVESEVVEVHRVVREAVEIVELRARKAGVSVEMDAPAELRCQADSSRLRQVLLQLLDNALKHAPPESCIRVHAGRDGDSPGRLVIRVSDEGPGIDPANAEAIFEPYRRFGRAEAGFGLGLPIARAVTELMDGDLVLEGDRSPGATFAVRLPPA